MGIPNFEFACPTLILSFAPAYTSGLILRLIEGFLYNPQYSLIDSILSKLIFTPRLWALTISSIHTPFGV